MKILILANNDEGLYKFRKELLEALLKNHKIHCSLPHGNYVDKLVAMGCQYHNFEFCRHNTNPFKELKLVSYYKKLIKEVEPDIVFTYTVKPNVYGGLACAKLNIPYITNITGLGTAIENPGILRKITLFLYRIGLRKAKKIFFQNEYNYKVLLENKIINSDYEILPGSGVNLADFPLLEYPSENDGINFLFIGRVMKDKGINEFISSAEAIKKQYQNSNFDIIGPIEEDHDTNIEFAIDKKIVNYYGEQANIKPFLQKAHCVVLPSYHEGMANVLLESASSGRPVIASNIPGCVETFDEGVSGFGAERKNADSLISAIEKFIVLDFEQKRQMGLAGRKKIEQQFDRNIVINAYLNEINKLLNNK